MKLRIVTIADRGVVNKERIHLSVLLQAEAAYYIVMISAKTADGRGIAAGARAMFWFTSKTWKAGDNVVLYTGQGTPSTEPRLDGGTNHFYFWGFTTTMFHDPAACAVLAELNWYAAS